ncbi:MAG: sodium:solute symporter [Saprospirales bacterium]|nr:MAG: sodium:solute symporter [Saprospirales bacterium]
METFGAWSLLPPLLAIILAIYTRQVFVSLTLGIWSGWLIISGGDPLSGTFNTIEGLVRVFQSPGNTRTIMFCALVGGLIVFMQRSGGVAGFIAFLNRRMKKYEDEDSPRNRIMVQLLASVTGIVVFVESSISVLTVGTLYRPLFDKMRISREKLAYIADSSSAPACILIPLNAWGAFIMGLLIAQGFTDPFNTMIKAAAVNFYAILALLLVFVIILTQRDFGPMRKAEKRARDEGKLMRDNAVPMVSEELTDIEVKKGIPHRARNMIVPIAVMVLMMPVMLAVTGWETAVNERSGSGALGMFFFAIGQGSGSASVLTAVVTALLVSMFFYKIQGLFNLAEMVDMTMKGIAGLMPLALLMLLAFGISDICRELQTGQYVADLASALFSPALVPALVFVISAFIAFSTGTSWGTFAIMIAISVPMAQSMEAPMILTIAAVLGGGVFGDHCSPISDTTILSSMASASDHIDHVRTQLPYALLAGGITTVLYLILGFIYV